MQDVIDKYVEVDEDLLIADWNDVIDGQRLRHDAIVARDSYNAQIQVSKCARVQMIISGLSCVETVGVLRYRERSAAGERPAKQCEESSE